MVLKSWKKYLGSQCLLAIGGDKMAVKEDKFIVFPKKDLLGISAAQLAVLDEIDQLVQLNRLRRGVSQFPKFITCNQDEPYAEEVWRIILECETAKERSV
jgi:hypothetical protein